MTTMTSLTTPTPSIDDAVDIYRKRWGVVLSPVSPVSPVSPHKSIRTKLPTVKHPPASINYASAIIPSPWDGNLYIPSTAITTSTSYLLQPSSDRPSSTENYNALQRRTRQIFKDIIHYERKLRQQLLPPITSMTPTKKRSLDDAIVIEDGSAENNLVGKEEEKEKEISIEQPDSPSSRTLKKQRTEEEDESKLGPSKEVKEEVAVKEVPEVPKDPPPPPVIIPTLTIQPNPTTTTTTTTTTIKPQFNLIKNLQTPTDNLSISTTPPTSIPLIFSTIANTIRPSASSITTPAPATTTTTTPKTLFAKILPPTKTHDSDFDSDSNSDSNLDTQQNEQPKRKSKLQEISLLLEKDVDVLGGIIGLQKDDDDDDEKDRVDESFSDS